MPIDFQDGGKAVEEPPQGAISIYRCMRCVQRSLLERMHPWLLVVLEFRHAVFVCTLLTNCCHGLNIIPSVILVLVVEFFWGGFSRGVCVTKASSSQTSSHALMRELDRRSLTLDLACGRAQPPYLSRTLRTITPVLDSQPPPRSEPCSRS